MCRRQLRNLPLFACCVLIAGCIQGKSTDPDGIGIGPIPDATASAAPSTAPVLVTDKADLSCLLQEVEIALAQAPADGSISFNGLNVCKITPKQ